MLGGLALAFPAATEAGTIVAKAVLEDRYEISGNAAMNADNLIRAQRSVVVSDKNGLGC